MMLADGAETGVRWRVGIALRQGGRSGPAPAELTWALILAASRHLAREERSLRAGGWQTSIGRTVHGRRLGVLDYGMLGAQVAGIGRAFGRLGPSCARSITGHEGLFGAVIRNLVQAHADA